MDQNQKTFNIYVFLSTFARSLIETFIGTILYKAGFSLHQVILYYVLVNLFSLILSYPCIKLSKDYSNRVLAFIGIISFIILQIALNHIVVNYYYLVLCSFLFGTYRRGYWISRRYYNLKVIKKSNIASTYSIISIVNQISVIFASYIGALLLDFISIKALTIISILLFITSVLFLYHLHFEHEKNNEKIAFFKTIKKMPFQNIYLFASYELLNVIKFFIPLYLFINVKNNYQTIGILQLISNLATLIFAYLYGKKINNNKNYLSISIIFTVIVYLAKVNVTTSLLFLISFLEGIATKMYELSINKYFYEFSKKFEYYNYNLVYEIAQNTLRFIVTFIIYLFIKDLQTMVYFGLLFMIIAIPINFKEIKNHDYKVK